MLGFANVENALAHHLRVTPENRGKFRNRIKQLQRSGWPRGSNNQHRSRVSYDVSQLLELAFVFELLQLGLSPERATSLVEFWWSWLRRAFLLAGDKPFPIVFAFLQGDFTGLAANTDRDLRPDEATATIGIDPTDSPEDLLRSLELLATSRGSVINVTVMRTGLTTGLESSGVESAFVWAGAEAWRLDLDENGRPLDPRKYWS